MKGIDLNTLENIEKVMPQIQKVLEGNSNAKGTHFVAGPVIAPLAEAIITLTREISDLKKKVKYDI